MVAAARDNLGGVISVGQGNLIMNMAGKILQIKKLELALGSMATQAKEAPFLLPGQDG